jgi:hypothetical protein
MSRLSTGDVHYVKPSNNVYTALAAIGTVVVILGVVALWMRASELGINFFG